MSGRRPLRGHRLRRTVQAGLPVVLLILLALALLGLPLYHDEGVSVFDIFNSFQSWAAVALLALGIGTTVIAGEFDLAAVGTFALSAMLAVTLGGSSPILGLLAALGAGLIVGLIQGLIVTRFDINSVPVTVGTYIALLGLTNVISGGDSVAYDNYSVGLWLDQTIAGFFSPRSLVTIAVVLLAAAVFTWTRFGRDVRALGGDRRAARTAGVRVDRNLVGVFVVSGLCASLGGALQAFSLATATPDPGTGPLIVAVTAVLLGGVSLAGGQGGAIGIALGALVLQLLEQLFTILATPAYVANLVLGGLLVVVVAIDAPDLRRRLIVVRARVADRGGGGAGD